MAPSAIEKRANSYIITQTASFSPRATLPALLWYSSSSVRISAPQFPFAVTYFVLEDESSKLSLEAVDEMYNVRPRFAPPSSLTHPLVPQDPNTKAWTSAKWVPAGHESRADFNQAIEAERKQNMLSTVQHRELADDDGHSENTEVGTAVGEKAKKEA